MDEHIAEIDDSDATKLEGIARWCAMHYAPNFTLVHEGNFVVWAFLNQSSKPNGLFKVNINFHQ
ncbi:MAG: hypothetical protein HC888_15175 [Candidatus Competibacteraceae bacterium]|nr:hypothetical protein [Candidatus Competibacteraceae bacterium]